MEGEDRRGAAARLIAAQSWLALATIDESGVPVLSYVPFAPAGGAFGIVVSRLAAHAANLAARRPASVLLVEDEAERRDAYTRTRLSVAVSVWPHAAESAPAEAIWSALEQRQGGTVRVLRRLPDFQAVSLAPLSGRLVLGFASAHDLGGAAIVELLRAGAG
ncbi:MAG: pyridoxamine 5'-phosphate oxidase family protein [Candidatus Eremiobacteraeota bacterium]|nr:pyridoxamine 5'-phosphate oxidase family protein [Candidatus Eremiobacteraeota bacterium]